MARKPESERERRRLMSEALADVRAGRVIDRQAVEAWTNSLNPHVFVLDSKAHADFLAMLKKPLVPSKRLRARMRRKPSWEG